MNEKTNGHILRSKTENYQYGEKSSKFFLNEKKEAIQNTIKWLASDPNNLESVTYSQTEIIQEIKDFTQNYSKELQQNPPTHVQNFWII